MIAATRTSVFRHALHIIPPSSRAGRLKLVRKADDESIPVRHAHLGQRLRVHRVAVADELVLREDVSGQSVDFVVGERPRLLPRHRPPDEVEHGGGIAPEDRKSTRLSSHMSISYAVFCL